MKVNLISTGLTLLLLSLSTACSHNEKKPEVVDDMVAVEMTKVRRLQPLLHTVLPGELKPWNRTQIFPKVKGYLASITADRGTQVKKGQVLATLEAPELIASLNQAKAEVSSAEAALLERHAKQQASRNTYLRILQTSKTKGAVSDNELEMGFASMMADSALARVSRENLQAARAQLEAQNQLAEYLLVKAPFNGFIIERNVSPGDLVGPETNVKPMFVLEDGSKLRLTVAIPENLANSIGDRNTVSFTTQAEPLKEYHAVFARSANSVQEHTRTMLAEFDFINHNADLKAGMYAEVNIPVRRNKASLFVPKTSVLLSTEGIFVMKVNANVTQWISVQRGNSLDSLVEVFGPVSEDDQVIKTVNDELRNGQVVRIKSR
ncbi:MAG: efflux RND transporter periplasmic adaptor subunit [Cyclobacteriaceae bacterium]|nr:efflux RND transporter periplasmic adaptor subunit [Cyclobacteriaceae bacterium]